MNKCYHLSFIYSLSEPLILNQGHGQEIVGAYMGSHNVKGRATPGDQSITGETYRHTYSHAHSHLGACKLYTERTLDRPSWESNPGPSCAIIRVDVIFHFE